MSTAGWRKVTRYTFLPDHTKEYFISAFIQHLSEALQKKIVKTDQFAKGSMMPEITNLHDFFGERERAIVSLKHLKQLFN